MGMPERYNASTDPLDYKGYIDFDLGSYLAKRTADPNFVMVEIGHGGTPAVVKQQSLVGQRAYIGIESWLRDTANRKRNRIAEILAARGTRNIFFVTHELGGEVVRDEEDELSWFRGEYNSRTILPDSAADEVLLSNVFGDPHLGNNTANTVSLLSEAARLIGQDGKIIIRETITPTTSGIRVPMIEETGLVLAGVITPEDVDSWVDLEMAYAGEAIPIGANAKDHYLFLSKDAGS